MISKILNKIKLIKIKRNNINKEWIKAIREDIKLRYKIKNPRFTNYQEPINSLYKFSKKNLKLPGLWIQYEKKTDKTFDLKSKLAMPDTKVCYKIIQKYLLKLPTPPDKSLYTLSFVEQYSKVKFDGDTPYTYKEVKKELLYIFRQGRSKIVFDKEPIIKDNKTIYHLFVEQESLENMLKSGYLDLEFKN